MLAAFIGLSARLCSAHWDTVAVATARFFFGVFFFYFFFYFPLLPLSSLNILRHIAVERVVLASGRAKGPL